MRFVVEIMTAVGHDMIFVLVRFERNAVSGLFEQVDRRRRVKRKHRRLHRGGKPRVDLIEGEEDIDGLRLEPRQHLVEAGKIAAEKLARKHEEFAQQIEALEYPMIVGEQRILAIEPDLMQALRRRRIDHGIAKLVEIAEVDAPCNAQRAARRGRRNRPPSPMK